MHVFSDLQHALPKMGVSGLFPALKEKTFVLQFDRQGINPIGGYVAGTCYKLTYMQIQTTWHWILTRDANGCQTLLRSEPQPNAGWLVPFSSPPPKVLFKDMLGRSTEIVFLASKPVAR